MAGDYSACLPTRRPPPGSPSLLLTRCFVQKAAFTVPEGQALIQKRISEVINANKLISPDLRAILATETEKMNTWHRAKGAKKNSGPPNAHTHTTAVTRGGKEDDQATARQLCCESVYLLVSEL